MMYLLMALAILLAVMALLLAVTSSTSNMFSTETVSQPAEE